MNDITIFNHLGNNIRVMTDKQGEPLFVLKDICDAASGWGTTSPRRVEVRGPESSPGTHFRSDPSLVQGHTAH